MYESNCGWLESYVHLTNLQHVTTGRSLGKVYVLFVSFSTAAGLHSLCRSLHDLRADIRKEQTCHSTPSHSIRYIAEGPPRNSAKNVHFAEVWSYSSLPCLKALLHHFQGLLDKCSCFANKSLCFDVFNFMTVLE